MTNPIIAFRNVSKVFEDSGTQVLKDINFELEEGKFYTLLGASGSGKSNDFEHHCRSIRCDQW